jgi:hypothetical protein
MARILVLALPLFVGGCFLPVNMAVVSLVVNGFSVAATGKGTADHALSAISNRDCALLRMVKSEAVCRASETGPSPQASDNGASEKLKQEGVLRAGTKPDATSERYRLLYLSLGAAPTVLAGAMPR